MRKENSKTAATHALDIIIGGSVVFLFIIILLFIYIQGTFERQEKVQNEVKVANGELEKVLSENKAKNWLLTGTGLLNEKMQGEQSENELSGNILTEVCGYTGRVNRYALFI